MIGVFDSGYGGLTILRALIDRLPQYSYLYFGDNKNAPYGRRSAAQVYEFTLQGVNFLFSEGCELVILGCNTVSAAALRKLQEEYLPDHYPDRRVLGIVVPTIEQITGVPWKRDESQAARKGLTRTRVGVMTTELTSNSRVYEKEIGKRRPDIRVIEQPCSDLAEIIEEERDKDTIAREVKTCVTNLLSRAESKLDAVLLGCTHFELVAKEIAEHLPSEVALYEQPKIVAESLNTYLKKHPEIDQRITKDSELRFVTTGDPIAVSKAASRYFGQNISFIST